MSTNPPRGMRDFLPQAVHRRRYVIETIRRIYESYGFEPLETPALENLSVLMGKYGEEGDRLLFKVLKRGQKLTAALTEVTAQKGLPRQSALADLGLRYDLTVPLARVVGAYSGRLERIWKRYQIQPVWRADRPAKGRFREFYQCDVDVIGTRSPLVEAELLGAACQALEALGFKDFVVRLNHRGLLFGLLAVCGVAGARAADAVVAIDKLDKIGRAGVQKQLTERGVRAEQTDRLLDFIVFESQSVQEVFTRLESAAAENDAVRNGLDELRQIHALCQHGHTAGRVTLEPSLARGLSYYTGAIFEIVSPDLGVSLAGGGRYDDLIGMFGKQPIAACGISLGLERLLTLMEQKNLFAETETTAQIVVTCWNRQGRGATLAMAKALRDAGFAVDVYPESGKLGKQLKYAERKGARLAAIQGPDEQKQGRVALKDLHSGEQITVSFTDLCARVAALLQGK